MTKILRTKPIKKIVLLIVVVVPIIYIATCSYISETRNKAYELVKIGDTQEALIRRLGNPSVREKANSVFLRYTSKVCENPCVERLWYENRLALDIEAWSVELDHNNRVIKKTHWVSP